MGGGDNMVENYEITPNTLAIIPMNGKTARVMEEEESYVVSKSTTEIIDNSCKFFGSSYLGRHEGTKTMIGVSYKAPIIVEESRGVIFFPTCSPRYDNCYWISLNNIKDYFKEGKQTVLLFKNGQKITLDISYGSLENQILRSTRLESVLRKRKELQNVEK